jgi:putative colanic acid biosynthesis acetyltransferase WcaF
MKKVDLSKYDNAWYDPGAGVLKRLAWYYISMLLFQSYLLPVSGIKVVILRLFGARIGKGVMIKPAVNIKYPWYLQVGDHCWIGENVWIDNLAMVSIGSHVCLSQGAMLLTGNHDYKKTGFDLIVRGITLEDGVWVGARALVCPGVVCADHSVLTAMSTATASMEPNGIYSGSPAVKVRERQLI